MNIGVLKEIKQDEYRVALTPSGAATLISRGHNIFVETGCGDRADASDTAYEAVGATVMESARSVSENVDILTKVKEPQPEEFHVFREVQTLFSYIHSETRLPLIEMLLEKRITGIAMENVRTDDGRFPLLEPMSIIAGQQGVILGSQYLQAPNGGNGVSLIRFPGLKPANVVVLGAGPAGEAAARTAAGLGSNVLLTEISADRIRYLAPLLPGNVTLIHANSPDVYDAILTADMVVHTTTIPPNSNYHIITRDMLPKMKRGAVIVDVTANLGGGVETIDHYTSHSDPVWEVDGVIHYAVTNIPSAVAATASRAFETAHLPWLMQLADTGVVRSLQANPPLQRGLTSFNGTLCWHEAGTMQDLPWKDPEDVIAKRAK